MSNNEIYEEVKQLLSELNLETKMFYIEQMIKACSDQIKKETSPMAAAIYFYNVADNLAVERPMNIRMFKKRRR